MICDSVSLVKRISKFGGSVTALICRCFLAAFRQLTAEFPWRYGGRVTDLAGIVLTGTDPDAHNYFRPPYFADGERIKYEIISLAELEGGRLASAGNDGTITIWNPLNLEFLASWHMGDEWRYGFGIVLAGVRPRQAGAAACRGRFFYLASAENCGWIKIWELVAVGRHCRVLLVATLRWTGADVLAKLTDGGFASGHDNGTINIWSLEDADDKILSHHLATLTHVLWQDCQCGPYTELCLAELNGSGWLVSGAIATGTLEFWNISVSRFRAITYTFHTVQIHNYIATQTQGFGRGFALPWGESVLCRHVDTGGVVALAVLPGHESSLTCSGKFASGSDTGLIQIWAWELPWRQGAWGIHAARPPRVECVLAIPEAHGPHWCTPDLTPDDDYFEQSGSVLQLSPLGGDLFASISQDGTLKIWNVSSLDKRLEKAPAPPTADALWLWQKSYERLYRRTVYADLALLSTRVPFYGRLPSTNLDTLILSLENGWLAVNNGRWGCAAWEVQIWDSAFA